MRPAPSERPGNLRLTHYQRVSHNAGMWSRPTGTLRATDEGTARLISGSTIRLMPDHQTFASQATPLAQDVLAAADPYKAGMAMMSYAMGCVTEPGCDCPNAFWLIWGCLTDGFDAPRADATSILWATDAIRRASSEWLQVAQADHATVSDYLDRWVYEECGYASPDSN